MHSSAVVQDAVEQSALGPSVTAATPAATAATVTPTAAAAPVTIPAAATATVTPPRRSAQHQGVSLTAKLDRWLHLWSVGQ